jgi:AraC-like DNA-binding protein/quercetin dioxygenase-like cupin family protein
MEKNKKPRMVTVQDLKPAVRKVNYRDLKQGEFWRERTLPDVELMLVVSGRLEFKERGDPPIILGQGDVLFIPPNVWHSVRRIEKPSQAAFSCIMGELIPGGRWEADDYRFEPEPQRVTHTGSASAIHDCFMRCCEIYEGHDKYRAELLENLVREIFIRLSEYWSNSDAVQIPEPVRPMVSYLRAHLSEKIGRQDLARVFHVTPEHVNALFRRELGETPTQFLHRERVLRGYRYIRDNGLSVKEAAALVGFDDPFYFSRIFRRIFKHPPSSLYRPPK